MNFCKDFAALAFISSTLAAFGIVTLAQPIQAQEITYQDWNYSGPSNGGSCMISTWSNESAFSISSIYGSGDVVVVIVDGTNSIVVDRQYPRAELIFFPNRVRNEIGELTPASRLEFGRMFVVREPLKINNNQLVGAKSMVLTVEGKTIASFSLRGSGDAFRAWAACATE